MCTPCHGLFSMVLYANPPSTGCTPPHQINDLQSFTSSATTASSSSSLPRHVMGGLLSLFSSPVTKQSSAASVPLSFSSYLEEKGSLFMIREMNSAPGKGL
ncbi:hypothetical protein MLD38_030768 [Melastoma candidum]|uniref:Uncharacterized protein n=1 Tax=Melastoma candidum TaxID=119954 RepID=A0ACB9MMC9_9MYRT|nr:hypothetical protein MLD38_030768 [Melastoma candidum]